MKICYLGWGDYPHLRLCAQWFAEKEHEVHVISCHAAPPIKGVVYHYIPKYPNPKSRSNIIGILKTILRLRQRISRLSPDILHAHSLYYPGLLVPWLGWRPYVVTAWSINDTFPTQNPVSKFSRSLQWLSHLAIQKACLVTGISEDLTRWIRRAGAAPGRVKVFNWGVDLRRFRPPLNKSAVRKDLRLPTDKTIVLSMRNLGYPYNVERIVENIPMVISDHPETVFVFLWNYARVNRVEDLKSQVHSLGLEEIVFCIGHVAHEVIHKYYQASDIFVSVPSWDSGPLSLMEAMACGVSPVLSDIPCVREWIQDGHNGLLVDAKDVRTISQALIRMIADKNLRDRCCHYNLRLVHERADRSKNMPRLEQLYERVISQGNLRAS